MEETGPAFSDQPGLKVRVYYDTERPERAVLERELTNSWLLTLGVGVIFIFVALLLAR